MQSAQETVQSWCRATELYLKNRGLAGGLRANDGDLGEVYGLVACNAD